MSLHLQNVGLYGLGALVNAILFFSLDSQRAISRPLFDKWNLFVILTLVGYGIYGLFVSKVLKSMDSITKMMCSSASLLLTNMLTWLILKKHGTIAIYIALSIVMVAVCLYGYGSYLDKKQKEDEAEDCHATEKVDAKAISIEVANVQIDDNGISSPESTPSTTESMFEP